MTRARRLTPREVSNALEAAARSCARWMVNNYAGGARTIKHREPCDSGYHYSSFHSTDFASAAGVGTEVALTHLVRLSSDGRVIEAPRTRPGAVRSFRVPREQYDVLAREIIAQLVAEGLPFDDDWKAARAAAEPKA